MKIKTRYYPPPIPDRDFDWSAVDDDTYEEGHPIGYGASELKAALDLLEQLLDELEDAA